MTTRDERAIDGAAAAGLGMSQRFSVLDSRHESGISSMALLTYVTQMSNVIVITAAPGPGTGTTGRMCVYFNPR